MDEDIDILERARSRVGTYLRQKYRIDRVLGYGGMSVVYAATHRNLKRFAIKMLHPELSLNHRIRKRFVQEGYIANSIGHPAVVQVWDDDVSEDGDAFLVLELLSGTSLDNLCGTPEETVPVREVLLIVLQLLDVLEAAHEKGIIHRDLKPSNLFLTRDGSVKILDFGIARMHDTTIDLTHTRTGLPLGTPTFMAPEQASGVSADIDSKTDIWAVGATMFTLLSSSYVHDGDNKLNVMHRAATMPARSLIDVSSTIPLPVAELVDKALAFKKTDRFESVVVMREAVKQTLQDLFGPTTGDELASLASSIPVSSDVSEKQVAIKTEISVSPQERKRRTENRSDSLEAPEAMPTAKANPQKRLWIAAIIGPIVVMVILGSLFWPQAPPQTEPGKVSLVATTDMAVPNDLSWIVWSLSADGGKSAFAKGSEQLTSWKQLPIQLTDVNTSQTDGVVHLEVKGYRGKRKDDPIIEQSVLFRVPSTDTMTLRIPLDWSCTAGVLSSPCKADQLCRAGACIDATLTKPVDRMKKSSPSCFDTQRCFSSGMITKVPYSNGSSGECLLTSRPMYADEGKANIALLVNEREYGHFGVCDINDNRCLLPLDSNSPTGWSILRQRGKIVGIRFPREVCDQVAANKIKGVVVAPLMPGCESKSSDMPLCQAPDSCIETNGICPEGLPTGYRGYTCSGAAYPLRTNEDLIGCFVPNGAYVDDVSGPFNQWCCTEGEQPKSEPLLIDDMSGGPQVKLTPPDGKLAGFWWTGTDARDAALFPGPFPGLFSYRKITPTVTIPTTGREIKQAACLKSSGFSGWYAMMGFSFLMEKNFSAQRYFDVSPYTGIRFFAASMSNNLEIKVGFADKNTFTEDPRSTCNLNPKDGKCGDDWAHHIRLTSTWKAYEVKWQELKQGKYKWGQAFFDSFDAQHVASAYFSVEGLGLDKRRQGFDFCVSQISFIQE